MSDYLWLIPPVIIGFLALWSNVILGRQVLKRGVIFIDLAMAQIAALGVLYVEMASGHAQVSIWEKLAASWIMTLCAAGLLMFLERVVKQHLEAVIGLLYVLAACSGILMVSTQPHGKELIDALLNGRLLWAGTSDIFPVLAVALVLIVIQQWKAHWLDGRAFYLLFALAIPPLVINVGVYLEFAALIIPALALVYLPKNTNVLFAVLMGCIAGGFGFMASLWWDLPIGPIVVVAMALVALVVVLAARLIPRKDSEQEKVQIV